MKVGLIVGSLRKESWNKKVALVVKELLQDKAVADLIDITSLPLYNQDLDGEVVHEEYRRVREEIKKYDAYIFFIPEYNRTFAPAIKNVIDIGSRDPKGNPWAKKPAAVFSASMGGYGAMAGNHAIRQAFIYVDLIPMQQPEIYLSKVQELFDENGQMVQKTKDFLENAVKEFLKHSEIVKAFEQA